MCGLPGIGGRQPSGAMVRAPCSWREDVVDGGNFRGVVGGEDGARRVSRRLVHAFAGEGGPE